MTSSQIVWVIAAVVAGFAAVISLLSVPPGASPLRPLALALAILGVGLIAVGLALV